jgi:hypothetical protein
MGKNLRAAMPKDFALQQNGSHMTLVVTIKTQQELRAVIWALELVHKTLPSHRMMVAEDIGLVTPPPPSIRDKLVAAGLVCDA